MIVPIGTTYVLNNEPCFGLCEVHIQSPENRGFHRYQMVQVVRDDKIAEYREDLGLADKFKGVAQINIPGGVKDKDGKIFIEHTVGELRDIALQVRNNPQYDRRELAQVDKVKD